MRNIKLLFFLFVCWILPCKLSAQFYTAPSDSTRIRPYSFIKGKQRAKASIPEEVKTPASKEGEQPEQKDSLKGKRSAIAIPLQTKSEQELFGKLQERMNVCLPLDFLKVSSKYGQRKDPFSRCDTFHDGVDLKCKEEEVYAMLPAVVKKVHRGNKGYGNYVILSHGKLECLYGHLAEITVKEKDIINAGTVVGISGNTGKSTGYHLHIRLRKEGKSVDPLVFISFLETYIASLNKELGSVVSPRRHSALLNLQNVHAEIIKQQIKFPHIVLAQAALETGHFSSRVCLEYNNLFGLRRPSNGEYYRFDRWEDSVKAYRDYVQYKYRGGNYYQFLDRIGYAEDKEYTLKVRKMVGAIAL